MSHIPQNSVLLTGGTALAQVLAEFVRQGVTFTATETAPDTYRVTLTGGY